MRNSRRDRQLFRAGRGALGPLAALERSWVRYDYGDGWRRTLRPGHRRGDPVRANSPPGIEVTLGSKRVLQAGEPTTLD